MAENIRLGGRGVSTRLRELAIRGLESTHPLQPAASADLEYVSITIDPAMEEALESARKRMPVGQDWSQGQIIAALAVSVSRDPKPVLALDAPSITVAALSQLQHLKPRAEQLALASLVDQAIHHRRIALLEAATGSGKGLVIAAAAFARAVAGGRVALAAPTHQINRQTLQHLRDDMQRAATPPVVVAQLLGRSSFVSECSLLEALDDHQRIPQETRTSALAWLAEQAERFRSGEREGVYLIEPLLKACPELPKQEITLRAHEDSEAARCYEIQFQHATQAQVVVMTHTMLALLTRKHYRSLLRDEAPDQSDPWREVNAHLAQLEAGAIGRFDLLLIDEAHTLESNFAGALSEVISLRAMEWKTRQLAEHVAGSSALVSAITAAVAQLADAETGDLKPRAPEVEHLQAINFALADLLKRSAASNKKKGASPTPAILRAHEDLQRKQAAISFALNQSSSQVMHLQHSPDKRFPQISIGPRSIKRVLDYLWQSVESAALFSATLYVQTSSGIPTCNATIARLHIDPLRALTHLPTLPDWLTHPVTLHLPPQQCPQWQPPAPDAPPEIIDAYYEAIGSAVNRICEPVRGGALVLCTSYEAVSRIAAQWRGDPARLVAQSRDRPFAAVLRHFGAAAAAGERPVWVATGSAWTGMDIYAGLPENASLPPPELDDLLTHLVIPRLPFDINTTSTELARRQYAPGAGWFSVLHECVLQMRQGMGRLIRRPGLRDRHLIVLDPRGTNPHARGMSPIRNLWMPYPHRATLSPVDPAKAAALAVPPAASPAPSPESKTLRRVTFAR